MFGVVLLVTGSFWLIARLLEPHLKARKKCRDRQRLTPNSDVDLLQD